MIDISVPLRPEMDVWEGDPTFQREEVCKIEKEGCNVSKLTMSSHCGTHVDAPCHYVQGGDSMEKLDLGILIGRCQLIEIGDDKLHNGQVTRDSLADQIQCERILLKTRNSKTPGKFSRNSVSLDLEAAKLINEKNVKLVGVDGFSVESYSGDGSVHKELLSKKVVLVETLDLSHACPGFYELICLPIKIEGCDGAPARVVLKPVQ